MKTNTKTKSQIIQETGAFFNSNNRSTALNSGHCLYMRGDKRCAFSRCCEDTPEVRSALMQNEGETVIMLDVESLLKPEYRGRPLKFWFDIQDLHDNAGNWDENGLSEKGQEVITILLYKWSESL